MTNYQELATVATGSTLATVGGFGSALLSYVNEAPSPVTGGAFFIGLAGVCTALTPLILKTIDALKLRDELGKLKTEIDALKTDRDSTALRERANREWMIAAAASHDGISLPDQFYLVPLGKCGDHCPNTDACSKPKPKPAPFKDPDTIEE